MNNLKGRIRWLGTRVERGARTTWGMIILLLVAQFTCLIAFQLYQHRLYVAELASEVKATEVADGEAEAVEAEEASSEAKTVDLAEKGPEKIPVAAVATSVETGVVTAITADVISTQEAVLALASDKDVVPEVIPLPQAIPEPTTSTALVQAVAEVKEQVVETALVEAKLPVVAPMASEPPKEAVSPPPPLPIKATVAEKKVQKVTMPSPGPVQLVKIHSVDMSRFPASNDTDEMRMLQVTLRLAPGAKSIDGDQIAVYVSFFDQIGVTGVVRPTRAITTASPQHVPKRILLPGEKCVLSFTYVVPRGFRLEERLKYGTQMSYYGYLIRVFCNNSWQDEKARPVDLIGRM